VRIGGKAVFRPLAAFYFQGKGKLSVQKKKAAKAAY
jgi:hypothetical protein